MTRPTWRGPTHARRVAWLTGSIDHAVVRVQACLLNYKTAPLTLRALDALIPEVRAMDGARVCIVDNDSQDGSFEALQAGVAQRGVGDVVDLLQSGRNGGYGFGNNVALRHALSASSPPDYCWLVNSDAFVEPGALRALVDYLDAHPAVGVASSFVHGTDGSQHAAAFTFPSVWSEIESSARFGPLSRLLAARRVARSVPERSTDDVDWVTGASMMIRRSVLEQVGMFDESYFLYFEETDLCRRARAAGFRVGFVREASVAHLHGASTGVGNLQRRTPGYLFDSRRYYFLKHHGRPYLWAANLARGLGLASFRVRRTIQRKADPDYQRALADFVAHCLKHP